MWDVRNGRDKNKQEIIIIIIKSNKYKYEMRTK